jgi:hypothetical protein
MSSGAAELTRKPCFPLGLIRLCFSILLFRDIFGFRDGKERKEVSHSLGSGLLITYVEGSAFLKIGREYALVISTGLVFYPKKKRKKEKRKQNKDNSPDHWQCCSTMDFERDTMFGLHVTVVTLYAPIP